MTADASPARLDPAATLIVTRPEPEAQTLVDALIARGRRAWALPVLAIEKTDDEATLQQAMSRVDDYALVVFVSPNAIRRALAMRTEVWPRHVVIGVMGPGSVETLKTLCIATPDHRVLSPGSSATDEVPADSERFDSEALFAALDEAFGLTRVETPAATAAATRAAFTGRVLIVRGNGGRAWFAERLRGLGIAVDEVVAYRRVRPVADRAQADALRDAFDDFTKPAFVVTSSEGIANLIAIVHETLAGHAPADLVRDWLFASALVVPHRRIATKAREAGFTSVVVTASGDRGILAAIE